MIFKIDKIFLFQKIENGDFKKNFDSKFCQDKFPGVHTYTQCDNHTYLCSFLYWKSRSKSAMGKPNRFEGQI